MTDISKVETMDVVNEAEEKSKKKHHDKPLFVQLQATTEDIVLSYDSAIPDQYFKSHFAKNDGQHPIRPPHVVKMPVSRDRLKFTNVPEYFRYLVEHCKYSYN